LGEPVDNRISAIPRAVQTADEELRMSVVFNWDGHIHIYSTNAGIKAETIALTKGTSRLIRPLFPSFGPHLKTTWATAQ
jgi:hypothetical protein